jgi:hypothetical protein
MDSCLRIGEHSELGHYGQHYGVTRDQSQPVPGRHKVPRRELRTTFLDSLSRTTLIGPVFTFFCCCLGPMSGTIPFQKYLEFLVERSPMPIPDRYCRLGCASQGAWYRIAGSYLKCDE